MAHKILIVEDHPAIRSMLVAIFKNHSYETDEAADGSIGLQKARQGGYRVILLDLKLPQLDGFEILKQLRQIPPPVPNGPIIVFTSYDYEHAVKEAMSLGAADFIVKDNLDTANLIAKVEQVIANSQ
jgi:CheY-like chemotaxis protein